MHEERRFIAGVNLDCLVVGPVLDEGLSRPFLVLGSDITTRSSTRAGPRCCRGCPVGIAGSGSSSRVTTVSSISAAASGSGSWTRPSSPLIRRHGASFGDIDDALSQEIVVRVTTTFFERHLRHRSEPTLDIPSAYYAELEDRTDTIG